MILPTMPDIEDMLEEIGEPDGFEWLRERDIVYCHIEGDCDQIRWVANLAEAKGHYRIVGTFDVRLGPVKDRAQGMKILRERIDQTVRDIKEFREKLDAKADDAGRA